MVSPLELARPAAMLDFHLAMMPAATVNLHLADTVPAVVLDLELAVMTAMPAMIVENEETAVMAAAPRMAAAVTGTAPFGDNAAGRPAEHSQGEGSDDESTFHDIPLETGAMAPPIS